MKCRLTNRLPANPYGVHNAAGDLVILRPGESRIVDMSEREAADLIRSGTKGAIKCERVNGSSDGDDVGKGKERGGRRKAAAAAPDSEAAATAG